MSALKKILPQTFFALILINLLLFMVVRFLCLVVNQSYFMGQLTPLQILEAFVVGTRFDLAGPLRIWILLSVLFYLPFGSGNISLFFRSLSLWLIFIIFVGMFYFGIADAYYFGHTGRHAFDELLVLANDWYFLVELARTTYLLHTLGIIVAAVVFALLWKNLLRFARRDFADTKIQWISKIVIVLVTGFLLSRGSLGRRPLAIVDTYISSSYSQAQLIQNPVFTSIHGILNTFSETAEKAWTLRPDRLDVLREFGFDGPEKNPFWQAPRGANLSEKLGRRNIVLFLLESWNANYLPAFQKEAPEFTPVFTKLADSSMRFQNFFAGGTRSIEAIQTILTGFPSLQGFPNLGQGFELLNVSQLGALAKAAGYRTIFAQSSPRRSYSLDSAAMRLGFEEYYGQEDFKDVLDYGSEPAPQFGWDHNTFMSIAEKLDGEKDPFLVVIFTGTTHTPFRKPPNIVNEKEHLEDNKVGFLNTLHYSDWSLGEFFNSAKNQDWFKDTLFLFTADHTLQAYDPSTNEDRFRVPLLLYQPGVVEAKDVTEAASHLDLFPTILDAMDIRGGFAAAGRSLLQPGHSKKAFAYLSGRYEPPGLVSSDLYLRIEGDRALDLRVDNPACDKEVCVAEWQEFLYDFTSTLVYCLKNNIWDLSKP